MSAAALEAARGWIGTPYAHGAAVRSGGCDCLGLVRGVWAELMGEPLPDVPRYSPDWAETGGSERLMDGLSEWLRPAMGPPSPGEVIVLRMKAGGPAKHAGIIGEAGTLVHAYGKHGVIESPLSRPWERRIAARLSWPRGRT